MLDRLHGLENEYAIRFEPAGAGVERPDHADVFRALKNSIAWTVETAPGARNGRDQFFVSNGGSFCYEALPSAYDGGLIEGATPEVRGPGQSLLYQRAQEELLLRAIPRAERTLANEGHPGSLGLLRNARDAEGHIYGPQENYEAVLARGPELWLLRACLPVVMVGSWLTCAALWLLIGVTVVVGLPLLLAYAIVLALRDPGDDGIPGLGHRIAAGFEVAEMAITLPLLLPFLLLLRGVAFRGVRRTMTAFLVTRTVFAGVGTLDGDVFGLSEKGPAVRRVTRVTALPFERPIFDFGNLCKQLQMPFFGRMLAPWSLWNPRQRLQLGFSHANRADVAGFLKVGATGLLLDLEEAGALDDAPRLRRPVKALHRICADVELKRSYRTSHGEMTALAIQRWYLHRARTWVDGQAVASPEARRVLRLWTEVLDGLEADPAKLSGVLDWPTKRALIDAARPRVLTAALKKIDLRYHELGPEGYFTQLRDAGLARQLVEEAAVAKAVANAPPDTPAHQRGQLISALGADADVRFGWAEIRQGRGLRAEVIPLDRFRR